MLTCYVKFGQVRPLVLTSVITLLDDQHLTDQLTYRESGVPEIMMDFLNKHRPASQKPKVLKGKDIASLVEYMKECKTVMVMVCDRCFA